MIACVGLCSNARGADEPAAAAKANFERAQTNFQEGKFPEALTFLDQVDQAGAPNAATLDLRGRIMVEQGHLDEAAKIFEVACTKENASVAGLHLGDLLLRVKKFPEALEAYRKATKETNILPLYERLRFGMLLAYLGEKNDLEAQPALDQIKFPSESGAYYFAQAAWSFAHGQAHDAGKWLKRADEIFPVKATAWFRRRLFEAGWLKEKPAFSAD
ncbi:MAG: hypothetical protein M3Y86_07555 [Verrucomicrobiota bacterium]|nr:hypothetical protein [Verrucomicrobiota bacterium]